MTEKDAKGERTIGIEGRLTLTLSLSRKGSGRYKEGLLRDCVSRNDKKEMSLRAKRSNLKQW